MTVMLLSRSFVAELGGELAAVARGLGIVPEIVHLPDGGPQTRLSAADCARVEVVFMTRDLRFSEDDYFPKICAALPAAQNLKWMHFNSAAIEQYDFVQPLLARGVTLTTSSGSNGAAVAQTAIAGLLLLSRGFPRWLDAQRRHAWEPVRGDRVPADLRGQTVAVVGLGHIGMRVARFCEALGMHVIGVRRTPYAAGDPVGEICPPAEFATVLPRCQWVILACPLTAQTRHLMNADTLGLLPQGAGLINVARGALVDEPALVEALRNGRLGCAYLDVFAEEPLPSDSPLWDMPNVVVTPHNASAAAGNERRCAEIFLQNLDKFVRGQPLTNVHTA